VLPSEYVAKFHMGMVNVVLAWANGAVCA
jgi:hypothetical protein